MRTSWSTEDGRALRSALILASFEKPAVRQLAGELEPWLAERLERVTLRSDLREFCTERERNQDAGVERPDLVCVLGGDGSLLSAVRSFAEDPVPTLGINLGRVGFLASTPASHWQETLEGVLEGRGTLELRTRLTVRIEGQQCSERVALNDIALERGSRQGMLTASLFVGEEWVSDYRADGVIVATPSGSTAYSLSAGGPVLEPSVPALVVTPICSQGLSNRPIVLSDRDELKLSIVSASGLTNLAVDGQAFHSMEQGDCAYIARHPVPYPLFAMPGLDPYRRLRDRLGWRGSIEATERAEGS
jgi:NAD+ kinase